VRCQDILLFGESLPLLDIDDIAAPAGIVAEGAVGDAGQSCAACSIRGVGNNEQANISCCRALVIESTFNFFHLVS